MILAKSYFFGLMTASNVFVLLDFRPDLFKKRARGMFPCKSYHWRVIFDFSKHQCNSFHSRTLFFLKIRNSILQNHDTD